MRREFEMRFAFLILLSVALAGCGRSQPLPVEKNAVNQAATHTHAGWWCDEHGMPEDVCAQCNTKVAADFKRKGDWCSEHDRPESQCFVCHPELEAKFAEQYEAKYGKKPPKPESEPGGSEHHHS